MTELASDARLSELIDERAALTERLGEISARRDELSAEILKTAFDPGRGKVVRTVAGFKLTRMPPSYRVSAAGLVNAGVPPDTVVKGVETVGFVALKKAGVAEQTLRDCTENADAEPHLRVVPLKRAKVVAAV